jgi:signal transduction histidine kinase
MERLLGKLHIIATLNTDRGRQKMVILSQVMDKIRDQLKSEIATRNIKMHVEVGKYRWKSHEDLVHATLFNIVENAINFSPEGGEVFIKASKSKKKIQVVVKDHGVGIEKHLQKKVFKMFYRGNENSIGNGLGLFVSKKVARKLSARIMLKSNPKEGTEVTVVF